MSSSSKGGDRLTEFIPINMKVKISIVLTSFMGTRYININNRMLMDFLNIKKRVKYFTSFQK